MEARLFRFGDGGDGWAEPLVPETDEVRRVVACVRDLNAIWGAAAHVRGQDGLSGEVVGGEDAPAEVRVALDRLNDAIRAADARGESVIIARSDDTAGLRVVGVAGRMFSE